MGLRQLAGASPSTLEGDSYATARAASLADGADEVHMQTIARNLIAAYKKDGTTRAATGELL